VNPVKKLRVWYRRRRDERIKRESLVLCVQHRRNALVAMRDEFEGIRQRLGVFADTKKALRVVEDRVKQLIDIENDTLISICRQRGEFECKPRDHRFVTVKVGEKPLNKFGADERTCAICGVIEYYRPDLHLWIHNGLHVETAKAYADKIRRRRAHIVAAKMQASLEPLESWPRI